jgi:hypothetical protein
MKRSLIALTVAASLLLSGCGADEKVINGTKYATYGFIDKDENKNPNIQYKVSGWSIFWSIILIETIIAPVYFLGFDLYEPVGPIDPAKGSGVLPN